MDRPERVILSYSNRPENPGFLRQRIRPNVFGAVANARARAL